MLGIDNQMAATFFPIRLSGSAHLAVQFCILIGMDIHELQKRKERLERRLALLGITRYQVTFLPYPDYSAVAFQLPYDVGCRLFVLYGLVFAVQDLAARPQLIHWFKREGLWDHVSENERSFLSEAEPDKKQLSRFSWGLEGALTLGWVLGILENLPGIEAAGSNEEIDAFFSKIPELGEEIQGFLSGLKYRDLGEIYEENLVNELATSST